MSERDDPWEIAQRCYGTLFGVRDQKDLRTAVEAWRRMEPDTRQFVTAHLSFLALAESRAGHRATGRARRSVDEVGESVVELRQVVDAFFLVQSGSAVQVDDEDEPDEDDDKSDDGGVEVQDAATVAAQIATVS